MMLYTHDRMIANRRRARAQSRIGGKRNSGGPIPGTRLPQRSPDVGQTPHRHERGNVLVIVGVVILALFVLWLCFEGFYIYPQARAACDNGNTVICTDLHNRYGGVYLDIMQQVFGPHAIPSWAPAVIPKPTVSPP